MTLEELRSGIEDLLDLSVTDHQMADTLLARVNGSASLKQVLTAAISIARARRNQRIEELEQQLADAEDARDEAQDELQNLLTGLETLTAHATTSSDA